MLELLNKEHLGVELAPGRVAHTMFYAFLDDKIIGRLSLRHTLNEYLKTRGGHLGYSVAPKFRRKGYAKEIMRLGLKECINLNINPILVTCGDDNVPSIKIIEHFGGSLENIILDLENKEKVRRYWIQL
jgi:predicted acetyltransferase